MPDSTQVRAAVTAAVLQHTDTSLGEHAAPSPCKVPSCQNPPPWELCAVAAAQREHRLLLLCRNICACPELLPALQLGRMLREGQAPANHRLTQILISAKTSLDAAQGWFWWETSNTMHMSQGQHIWHCLCAAGTAIKSQQTPAAELFVLQQGCSFLPSPECQEGARDHLGLLWSPCWHLHPFVHQGLQTEGSPLFREGFKRVMERAVGQSRAELPAFRTFL